MAEYLQQIRRIDPILTNFAVGYVNPAFRADEIFRIIPHTEKGYTGQYPLFTGREKFKVATSTERSPGSETLEIYTSNTWDSYMCVDESVKMKLPAEYDEVSQIPTNLQQLYSELTTEKVLLGREYKVSTLLRDTTQVTSGEVLDSTQQFDNYITSKPYLVAQRARNAMQKTAGVRPNVLAMSFPVYAWLQFNPALVELIKYTTPAILFANDSKQILNNLQSLDVGALAKVESALAQYFNVDKVIVCCSVQDTQNSGQDTTPVTQYLWGYDMVFLYVDPQPTPDKMRPSAGYTFSKGGLQGDSWYDQDKKSTYIRSGQYYVPKLVMAGACYLVKNAVNSTAGIS